MKWLAQYKIKEIGRKERNFNFNNIPDTLEKDSLHKEEAVANLQQR